MDPAPQPDTRCPVADRHGVAEGRSGPAAQPAPRVTGHHERVPEQSAGGHEDLPDVRVLSQQVRRLQIGLDRAHEEAAGLRRALDTSRRIGIAVGILMARHHLTAVHAFDHLRQASNHQNIKLRDIAERVIYTGTAGVTD